MNVFVDRESYDAMRSSLSDSLKRERELSEENEKLKQEETSVDHALATLLAKGQEKKTPFHRDEKAVLKDGDMEIMVESFASPGKAAVVIHLTNIYSDEPWRFRDARLSADISSYTSLPQRRRSVATRRLPRPTRMLGGGEEDHAGTEAACRGWLLGGTRCEPEQVEPYLLV